MGIRGELFSTRFSCEGRTYFFNVKEKQKWRHLSVGSREQTD